MTVAQSIHVLLVEDDEDDYILTRSLLESVPGCKYALDWARTGDEALHRIDEHVADVVLLDYRLGPVNGVSIAKQLRERGYPVPIIMLTGQPSLAVDLEAMQAGIVDFLSKHEVTSDQLERSIRYAVWQARSAEETRVSRQFLSDALDALPQSIAILDDYGVIVAVNEAWRNAADDNGFVDPAHGIDMNYLDVCQRAEGRDAFDAIRVADAIRRTLDGEDLGFVLEYPCHSEEEERWFAVSVTRFRTPGAARVIVAHENVTRRIVAERELYAVAETMGTLMSSSPAAIIGVDEDVRVTHWSPAAERIFGWTKDEVLGKVNPLFAESEREEMLAYHQRVLDGEIVIGREVQRLTKDGRLVPVHVSVAPIALANQKPRGALGIFVDLTARVQIEDELRRQEQQYRALVENLPDIVVRYDRELRRLYANAAAGALISHQAPGNPPATLSDLGLLPGDQEHWTNTFQQVLETGEPIDVEWRSPNDGAIYETRVVPEIAPDGSPESVLVVSRDITDRKRTEDERRFLADASSRLASTLEFDATLSTIVELLVPGFADVCSISLFDDGGVPIRRVATVKATADGKVVPHPHLEAIPIEPTGSFGVSRVYRTGQAAVYPQVDIDEVLEVLSPASLRDAMRTVDIRSAMFVPLRVRGEAIGAIAFIYGPSGRRYSEAELPFAEDLANRAAIAIDNARLHHDLEQSEDRFRTLVEQIPAVVFTTGADDLSQPLYMSPHVEQMTGYTAEELIEREPSWYGILHPEDREFVVASDASIIKSGDARTLEYRMITRDGNTIWVREDARLIQDEAGGPRNWQGILSEVTLQKELEFQLTHQAFHDTLTGLPNRALFSDRVNHARERQARHGKSAAVCFMDLDNFKVINDSLGHSVGDELLIQVAGRLKKCRRSEDTAARFGGDEFAFLFEGLSSTADAIRVVTRIAESFDEPFVVQGRELFITPSIGLSVASADELANRDLLREADAAMYKAKRAGKDRFELYNSTLTTDAVNRLDLGNDLRKTLNGEQMEIHYQPVVELMSGRILGVEALVRWNHPEHGLIPPDRFIPIAEETAMIVDLGRWILKESCRQVHAWNTCSRAQEERFHLSVNLSARQFSDATLVDDVQSAINDVGFDPELLCLEITETVMMEDENAATQVLRRLKGLGVRLAVDDFGTGYSSLSSLRRFPVDQLKIDQSFVDGLINDPHDSIIVSGVIGLAHALDLEVIAEGVETAEQRDQLVALGCDLAQGYLFAKPLDGKTFERYFLELANSINTSEARATADSLIG